MVTPHSRPQLVGEKFADACANDQTCITSEYASVSTKDAQALASPKPATKNRLLKAVFFRLKISHFYFSNIQ